MSKEIVELGDEVIDPITGYKGVVIAISTWLWGCRRVGVQALGVHDGKPVEDQWFDDNRVTILVKGKVRMDDKPAPTGGPARSTGAMGRPG